MEERKTEVASFFLQQLCSPSIWPLNSQPVGLRRGEGARLFKYFRGEKFTIGSGH